MLYCSFYFASPSSVRPYLEYACVIWDPHLLKDNRTLEKVQKFALRVCSGDWNSGYDSLLDMSTMLHHSPKGQIS